MKKYLEILKKCELFSSIDDESLCRMLVCQGARVEKFDKKYTVFKDGASARYIGIVLSGSVQVVRIDFAGNRSILAKCVASDMLCEEFACAEVGALPVDVIADEPCEIMLIDASHILHTCENNCGFHRQLIYNLMKAIAKKTIAFHERAEITSKRTTREKLLTYLDIESEKAQSRDFEIPFDRQELADFLEVDRSGLSTEIGKLVKEGVIKNEKRRFWLL